MSERYTNEDRYEVVIELDTLDGDPKYWDWSKFLPNDRVWVRQSNYKGRATVRE